MSTTPDSELHVHILCRDGGKTFLVETAFDPGKTAYTGKTMSREERQYRDGQMSRLMTWIANTAVQHSESDAMELDDMVATLAPEASKDAFAIIYGMALNDSSPLHVAPSDLQGSADDALAGLAVRKSIEGVRSRIEGTARSGIRAAFTW